MKIGKKFTWLALSALVLILLYQPTAHADSVAVTIDTSSLQVPPGSTSGPFQLLFALEDASMTGDGNNTATLTNVNLGGGSVAGAPTIGGGVTGSLGSGLTFTDSDPSGMNYYVSGTFTPGNTLSFDFAMTSFADSNTSASGFAGDEFLVFILDAGGTDFVTTTDGSTPDTFLLATAEGQNGLSLQGNNIPGAAATTIVSSATATPEPGTFVLLAAGILMFAFRRRCFAIN